MNEIRYTNSNGVLLIDSVLQKENSIDLLDSHLENTKDWVRQLRGAYSFVYETDQHIVFGTDQFAQKTLWFFYDQDSKTFDTSSLPLSIEKKHGKAWSVQPNKIYILHKNSFDIFVETTTNWNFTQSNKNYDNVFELFEQSIKLLHTQGDTVYSLSGGVDSGVIHCAGKKLFNDVKAFTEMSLLTSQDKQIVKKRIDKNHKFFTDPGEEKMAQLRQTIIDSTIDCNYFSGNDTNAKINYLQNITEQCIITGLGGDALYGTYFEKSKGKIRTSTNKSFPDNLNLVFPWHEYGNRLYNALHQWEYIAGHFRKKIYNPLLDQRLFQAWLNTSVDLKNKRYKDWMKIYMDENHYTY